MDFLMGVFFLGMLLFMLKKSGFIKLELVKKEDKDG